MNIDLTKYDEQHAAYIEALSGKLESIYKEIIRLAVKYGLSVNFDVNSDEIFDFDKFPKLKKKVEELFDDMHEQITTLVQNAISTEWQFSADKYDFWLSEILSNVEMTKDEIEAYIKRNNESIQKRRDEALTAFRKRVENGMNLSDMVWKLTEQFKSELELALDVGIGEGKSADAISRDIRQYLNNPDKLFRRVRDKHGNLKLSKAAEAYHPGQGVYRSSYKNALRVARTEVNMAYRTADHENWSAERMVIGIRVSLSNNHTLNGKPFFDICDELKGIYPKEFKFTSWHPMCRCWATPITPTQAEVIDYTKKLMKGEDVSNYKFKDEVTELPKAFRFWYAKNYSRVARMRHKPNFITDNQGLIEGKPTPTIEPSVKEIKIESKLDSVIEKFSKQNIQYNEVKQLDKPLSEAEIIERLGGGDRTKGSCSSLAFAYAGNKGGLDVLDFRGGTSQSMFSMNLNITEIISQVGGQTVANVNDYKAVSELIKTVEKGKEYYFATGAHAAIIRKGENGFEYLELQSATSNGFKPLDNNVLKWRFKARKTHSTFGYKFEHTSTLVDIELLYKDPKFKELLGYLNTNVDKQQKGVSGTIK